VNGFEACAKARNRWSGFTQTGTETALAFCVVAFSDEKPDFTFLKTL
jgi:hypothetical protein